jgi:hypothetical protein
LQWLFSLRKIGRFVVFFGAKGLPKGSQRRMPGDRCWFLAEQSQPISELCRFLRIFEYFVSFC